MDNYKEKAIAIASKFPFAPFQTTASAEKNGIDDKDGDIAACVNHLDDNFMALLDQNAHLDINLLPL